MVDGRAASFLVLILAFALCIAASTLIVSSPDLIIAIITGATGVVVGLGILGRLKDDRQFLIRLWLVALLLRILTASLIYYFDLRTNLAPDWSTYDALGDYLAEGWKGAGPGIAWVTGANARYRSGWGMYYYVAAVYYVIGRNAFALQLLSCIMGASTSVLIYRIATMVVGSRRLGRLTGILTAIAPSHLIWTSQGIKEPIITLLLTTCLFYTMRLSEKMRIFDGIVLLLSLGALYSLRYYVFFVVFIAIAGALVVTRRQFSTKQILQGSALVLLIAFIFLYYGAGDVAQQTLDINRLQANREWSAKASESGYGGSVDISDSRQAITYLPLALVYFLFAPLPWMIRNFNHVVILPEMILWWLGAPFMFYGFWLAVRHRLRASLPLCLFTAGLTISYSLYLTNFGTAHRMRCQLLGFLIIFVGIGWETVRVTLLQRRGGFRARRSIRGLAPVKAGGHWEPYVRNRWHHNG